PPLQHDGAARLHRPGACRRLARWHSDCGSLWTGSRTRSRRSSNRTSLVRSAPPLGRTTKGRRGSVTTHETQSDRGSLSRISPQSVLSALQLPRGGKIYDLASGWWPGMPVHPIHPSFNVLTYRTPRGFQVQKDMPSLLGDNN